MEREMSTLAYAGVDEALIYSDSCKKKKGA